MLLEIRRALRSLGFIISFLAMHLLIFAVFFWKLALEEKVFPGTAARDPTGVGVHSLFWIMIWPFFMMVLPGLSMFALSRDIRTGSVELLLTTRLHGFDIVWGKWLSLVLVAALMACTLTPYVVLHYFATGSNPVQELMYLGIYVLISAILCSAGVTLSIIPHVWLRLVFAFFGLIFTYPIMAPMVAFLVLGTMGISMSTLSSSIGEWILGLLGFFCASSCSMTIAAVCTFALLSSGGGALAARYRFQNKTMKRENSTVAKG